MGVIIMGFSWLQISDVHIYDNSYYKIITSAYENLAKKIKPDFIVVTGDFCHYNDYPHYDRALSFLNLLVEKFKLKKDNIFLIPGNHDVRTFPTKDECISKINESVDDNPDAYIPYMNRDIKDLRQSFSDYEKFIRSFYGNALKKSDCRITNPSDVIAIEWKNKLNIIMLNTALVSKNDGRELFDIKKFLELKNHLDISLPSIILAHHSFYDIAKKQRDIAISFMKQINVKAYLCGDKHQCENQGIQHDFNNQIPMFISGKSVPEVGDKYSDITILLYRCNDEGRVYVYPYEWNMEKPRAYFVPSTKFNIDTDETVSFELYSKDFSLDIKPLSKCEGNIGEIVDFGEIDNIAITWKILDNRNGKLLLLCTHGIANKPFSNTSSGNSKKVSWNNCSLRKWLNVDFIANYFVGQEKWLIPSKDKNNFQTPVENEENTDKVFLLSAKEAKTFLKDVDYHVKLHPKCSSVGSEFWWLRSSGKFDNFIQGVLEKNNSIDEIGNLVYKPNIVRPAIWIDASFISKDKGEKYEK